MSFVDDNTAWTQPRLRDREMHKQSGYKKNVNGALVEMGMKSQIIGVSLKDDPDKVRGKAGELIFFEEAGSFPGLLKAWEVAMPTMRQGSKTLGTMVALVQAVHKVHLQVWKSYFTILSHTTVYLLQTSGTMVLEVQMWTLCTNL